MTCMLIFSVYIQKYQLFGESLWPNLDFLGFNVWRNQSIVAFQTDQIVHQKNYMSFLYCKYMVSRFSG